VRVHKHVGIEEIGGDDMCGRTSMTSMLSNPGRDHELFRRRKSDC
jgi:hypothetical protein